MLRLLRHQPAPEGAHHDREDRQRRDDNRADRDRRTEAHLPDVRDADNQQAGDRHHHDQARGHDRDAGRCGGTRGSVLHAVTRGSLLAVAADDQKRVVDAGAEAEHHRDYGSEAGQAERRREHRQQDLACRDAQQRADERRAHRPPGAKQQGQQHDGYEYADEFADGGRLLGRQVDQDAARLDLNLWLGGLARRDQRLAVRLLDIPGLLGVAHVDRRQAPVLRDLAARLERAGRQLHAVKLADLCERAVDRRLGSRIGDLALVDGEHKRRVHPAEGRRVRLEEIYRLLRLGPRQGEVVGGLFAGAGRQDQQHQDADRRSEAALPMRGQGARQAREKLRHRWCLPNAGEPSA